MGFSRPLRAKLYKVVVVLAEGDEPDELVPFVSVGERVRIESQTADDEIDPLFGAELFSGFDEFLEIGVGDLDGLQALLDAPKTPSPFSQIDRAWVHREVLSASTSDVDCLGLMRIR